MGMIELTEKDIHGGSLILVNQAHGMKDSAVIGLAPISESFPSVLMQRIAAKALSRLMEEIDGWESITAVSGWRSRQEQQDIWDDTLRESGLAFTRKYVAIPGHSEHQTGLAIDLGRRQEHIDFICPDFPCTGVCQTFRERAADFGFILRYPSGKESVTGIGHEPWHFRYVGTPHAQIMARQGMVLEEYIDYLKRFPVGSPPCAVETGQGEVHIRYMEASGGSLRLEVPEGCPYSVSGNNVDGFILTEWRDSDAHETKLRRP